MRVLTVRQPWATAIVRMGKDVENRTGNIAGDYRGPVAIHAGLALPPGRRGARTEFEGVGEVEYDLSGLLLRSPRLAWPYRLPLGVVIGIADLVDVHLGGTRHCSPDDPWGQCSPWAQLPHLDLPRVYHLVLANPRPLPRLIPAKGRLGLWRPDADLEAAINDQLALPAPTSTPEEHA